MQFLVLMLIRITIFLCLLEAFCHAQCIFNSTHCTCQVSTSPGLCCRYQTGGTTSGTCVVDDCQINSRTCDCSGSEICTVSTCDAWKPSDPNENLVLGQNVACSYSANGATCISALTPSPSPSASTNSGLTPSPASSPNSSPVAIPSTTPSASASPSASSSPDASSPGPSPSSSQDAANSASPTTSPPSFPSQNNLICPGANTTLDLHNIFPSGWSYPVINYTFSTTYDPGENLTARPLVVNGCTGKTVTAIDDYVMFMISASVPANPTLPGYCFLGGPSRYSMTFDSHSAMVFKSEGFTFQPTAFKIWDIDNLPLRDPTTAERIDGVYGSETVAVFGARDGNIILPTISETGIELESMTFTVPSSSMTEMGLEFGDIVAPGAQQKSSNNMVVDCDHETDRVSCAVTYSFAEPIDTMVVVYGFSEFYWPGESEAAILLENPTVQCP